MRRTKDQFMLEWGGSNNFFNTLIQAKKFMAGLYSLGLLFRRHVRIVHLKTDGTSKVVFEKSY